MDNWRLLIQEVRGRHGYPDEYALFTLYIRTKGIRLFNRTVHQCEHLIVYCDMENVPNPSVSEGSLRAITLTERTTFDRFYAEAMSTRDSGFIRKVPVTLDLVDFIEERWN